MHNIYTTRMLLLDIKMAKLRVEDGMLCVGGGHITGKPLGNGRQSGLTRNGSRDG